MADFNTPNNSDEEELGQSKTDVTGKLKKKTEDSSDKSSENTSLTDNCLQPETSKPSKSPSSDSDEEAAAASIETPPDATLPPIRATTPPPPPPIFPPRDKPGRNTNQLLYIKQKVMPALWAHKFGWPFIKPVDAIKMKLPDYHRVIKKPMDFGTIRKRLVNKYYWSSTECIEDINLVFRNCLIYNKPGQDIVIMTQKVAKVFETKIQTMMEQMETEQDMDAIKTSEKRQKKAPRESTVRKKPFYGNTTEVKERPLCRAELQSMDFESELPIAKKSLPESPGSKSSKQDSSEEESDSEDSEESADEWMF